MPILNNSAIKKKFISEFTKIKARDFKRLTKFTGDSVGFSYQEDHPEKRGSSLYRIGLTEETVDNCYVVYASADFGERKNGAIKAKSLEEFSLKDPVDVQVTEYTYDPVKNRLLKNGAEVTADDLLQELEEAHKKPTYLVKGFLLRTKLFIWKRLLPGTSKHLENILTKIYNFLTGDKIHYNVIMEEFTPVSEIGRQSKELSTGGRDTALGGRINFLGLDASRRAVFIFALIHILVYIIFFTLGYEPLVIKTLFKNNFLTLCYVLLSLTVLESLQPMVLKSAIKKLSRFTFSCYFRTIKI